MRHLYSSLPLGIALCSLISDDIKANPNPDNPNIIMIMADDLGWGDVGFNGNTVIKTPNLDNLAKDGAILSRFYSACAVSSPTRGSCITGRNPYRYGIYSANVGYIKYPEITIAEILKEEGYKTGHFGKWHLGTLSDSIPDGRRGGNKNKHLFSPPWKNGFDVCFSTEQAVPTWDPMKNQDIASPTRYWIGENQFETENLEGDDSRVIMDRVIPFIENASKNDSSFFAIIWFHAPHIPVVAGEEYKKMYSTETDEKQHYYGCITAMDDQIGRLMSFLKQHDLDENTIITFCSDNGPAGQGGGAVQRPGKRQQGITGGYKGRKGSLYEGGIRVPSIFYWSQEIRGGKNISFPMSTSDYFPTFLSALNIDQPSIPYDGINIIPAIQGKESKRKENIGFQFLKQNCLISDQYKIILPKNSEEYELYDLLNDPFEKENIASKKPNVLDRMKLELVEWMGSCQNSDIGEDY